MPWQARPQFQKGVEEKGWCKILPSYIYTFLGYKVAGNLANIPCKLCGIRAAFRRACAVLQLSFACRGRTGATAAFPGIVLLCWFEGQGSGVCAVPFASWTRSIIKNVPQVSPALTAGYFNPMHPIGEIISESNCIGADHIIEGRPT